MKSSFLSFYEILGNLLKSKNQPFNPDRHYFQAIPNNEAWLAKYASLVQTFLQKFPSNPKMPGLHPALRHNFQALKMNAAKVFVSKMSRIEAQFYQLNLERARTEEAANRRIARSAANEIIRQIMIERHIIDREKFYYKIFDEFQVESIASRKLKFEEWDKKFKELTRELSELYALVDLKNNQVREKFWIDFDKNREKHPRTIALSGTSLQDILNKLPWCFLGLLRHDSLQQNKKIRQPDR